MASSLVRSTTTSNTTSHPAHHFCCSCRRCGPSAGTWLRAACCTPSSTRPSALVGQRTCCMLHGVHGAGCWWRCTFAVLLQSSAAGAACPRCAPWPRCRPAGSRPIGTAGPQDTPAPRGGSVRNIFCQRVDARDHFLVSWLCVGVAQATVALSQGGILEGKRRGLGRTLHYFRQQPVAACAACLHRGGS